MPQHSRVGMSRAMAQFGEAFGSAEGLCRARLGQKHRSVGGSWVLDWLMKPSFQVLIWNGPFSYMFINVYIWGWRLHKRNCSCALCPVGKTDGSCLNSLGKNVEFNWWFQCQHQIHEPWLSHKGFSLKSWFFTLGMFRTGWEVIIFFSFDSGWGKPNSVDHPKCAPGMVGCWDRHWSCLVVPIYGRHESERSLKKRDAWMSMHLNIYIYIHIL